MTTKQITLNKFGIAEALIGFGLAPYQVPADAFILEKIKEGKIHAFYQNAFSLASMSKSVTAGWEEVNILLGDGLKPLPEYFDPATKELKDGAEIKWIESHPSESSGKLPNTNIYKYDGYSSMQVSAGDTIHSAIYRTCLKVFFELHYQGSTCVNNSGQLVQPVYFNTAVTSGEENTEVTVTPVDGIAPFHFSKDGVNYQENNVLLYEDTEPKTVYVKDSAGTIGNAAL